MEECKMREEIKDSRGKRIGYIEDALYEKKNILDAQGRPLGQIRPEGNRLAAYDKAGRKLGYWDKYFDTTYTLAGIKIGKGNLLLDFFFKN